MMPDSLSSQLSASDAAVDQRWAEARDFLIGPGMERIDATFALIECLNGPDPVAYLRRQPDWVLAMVGELANLAAQRMSCEVATRMLEDGGEDA
jgi:hypothetical protein